jgi:hypothetical protein
MPLMQCRDCGNDVSTKALACPRCGRLVRARGWWAVTIGWGVIMSAVISFLLTVLLIVALGAAGLGLGALFSRQAASSSPPLFTPRPSPSPFR